MDKIILILKLLPLIIEVVKAIEAAIPGASQGEAKLAMVRGALEVADSSINETLPSIEKVIALVVAIFNKTGTFSK